MGVCKKVLVLLCLNTEEVHKLFEVDLGVVKFELLGVEVLLSLWDAIGLEQACEDLRDFEEPLGLLF